MQNFVLTKSKILLIVCLAFISGILLAAVLPDRIIRLELVWFAGLIASLVLLSFFFHAPRLRLAVFVGVALFLALWRYAISLPTIGPEKIHYYNNQELTVVGVIGAEPEIRDDKANYLVRVENIKKDSSSFEVSGNLLVSAKLYPEYEFGDRLELLCKLKTPEKIEDFSYDRYLARYDIYSLCYYPEITFLGNSVASSGVSVRVLAATFRLKARLAGLINQGISEPEAALARGMLLGDQKGLPSEIKDVFARSGLSHIIAISGMNITMISSFLLVLFLSLGLWRQQAFLLIFISLFTYLALLGWPASAVRAGIMSSVLLLAILLGRSSNLAPVIIYTGVIMLLINPRLLRDDVGFQLSFVALLGIIYLYPIINHWFDVAKLPRFRNLRDYLALTLAAQAATLPIMLSDFAQFSLVAPLANLLILGLIPPLFILLFLGLVLAWFIPGLAYIVFLPGKAILFLIMVAAERTAALPFAVLPISAGRIFMTVYFLGLAGLVLKLRVPAQIDDDKRLLF